MPRIKAPEGYTVSLHNLGWGWDEPATFPSVVSVTPEDAGWDIVPMADLREGDFIHAQVTRDGKGVQGLRMKLENKHGVLGYSLNLWGGGRQFSKLKEKVIPQLDGVWFKVQTPRPPAPVNEFGPVSP